jgi:hypothetical protein
VARDSILTCLEEIGNADPTEAVFAILFAEQPELKFVFGLDRSGGVRRAMLQNCFEIIVDYASSGSVYANQLLGIYYNHAAYETTRIQFLSFFAVIGQWLEQSDTALWQAARAPWLEMEEEFARLIPES